METSSRALELQKLFEAAYSAANNYDMRSIKKNQEEFYYNDVEHQKSQFTQKQQEAIERTYNIPISTKITYSIIEQILSFITSTKPFVRLIASEDVGQEFVLAFQKAYHATWYENSVNREMTKALRDMLITGSGFLLVDKSDRNANTTNVKVEYISWKNVLIDPDAEKEDLSDADYFVIVRPIRKKKAEKLYDIKISSDAINYEYEADFSDYDKDFYPIMTTTSPSVQDKYKYVLIKDFFLSNLKRVYVSTEGDISSKKPEPFQAPNPIRMEIEQQIVALKQQVDQLSQGQMQMIDQNVDTGTPYTNEEVMQQQDTTQTGQQLEQTMQQIAMQIESLEKEKRKVKKTITKYKMKVTDLSEDIEVDIDIDNYEVRETTVIEKIRMIGDKIISNSVLNIDSLPLIMFAFTMNNNVNKTYGVTHYIQDLVKAQNKSIAHIMYDLATNGYRKGFIWRTTLLDNHQVESQWAKPNALMVLEPDPNLADNGKPYIIEPSQLNQSIQYLLEYFKNLIEYITGIFGIMQGDPSGSPQTFGGLQSLQNFGSQRFKLQTRELEYTLQKLAYTIVNMIKMYTPEDAIIKYFDQDGNQQEVQIIKHTDDIKFNVRVEMVSSLPTTRQMMAQLLGFIAQTAGDPMLTKLLTEKMLKIADVPEANEILEEMNTIQQMQQQIEQLNQQLEQATKELGVVKNQSMQKEIAGKVDNTAMKEGDKIKEEMLKEQYESKQGPENELSQYDYSLEGEDEDAI